MASVLPFSSLLKKQLADAFKTALSDAGSADPMLQRSDRADYQANGLFALAKKLKSNPRELATKVTAAMPACDFIQKIEVSGPGFLNITLTDRAIIEHLAARAADSREARARALAEVDRRLAEDPTLRRAAWLRERLQALSDANERIRPPGGSR